MEKRIAELNAEKIPRRFSARSKPFRRSHVGCGRLDRGEPLSRPASRAFAELTMPEAAEQILLEQVGKSLHFNEVTQYGVKAWVQGKTHQAGGVNEGIAASFRDNDGPASGQIRAVRRRNVPH